MKIHIETERLLMRDLELSDVDGMFLLDSDPEVHEFLGKKPIQTREQALANIQYVRNQYEKYGIGRWAVIDKYSGEFMGWSGLKYETEVRQEFDYYDLGYRFRKKFWGKGIATETAMASLKYGFEQLNLDEIGAAAEIAHVASNKILQKVGFQQGETFEFDGERCNWYSLKKENWSVSL